MRPSRLRRVRRSLFVLLLVAGTGATAQPGSPDPLFGDAGRVVLGRDEVDIAYAVALEPDGSVVAFGSSEALSGPGSREATMLRFAADGSPTLSRSYPNTAFGCSAPIALFAAERLADGDFLVAGYRQTDCSGVERDFVLWRLRPDGGVELSFDVPVFQGNAENARALALAPGDTVVTAGWSSLHPSDLFLYDVALARHLPDGALDTSFSGDGEVVMDIAGDYDLLYDVAVDPAGRILATGFSRSGGQLDLLLLRLLADGTPDPGFDGDGVLLLDLGGGDDAGRGLALDDQGRIVVAVQSADAAITQRRLLVLRLQDDGTPDPGFGDAGLVEVDFGTDAASPAALALDSLGRIVVAGTVADTPGAEASQDFAMAVLDASGQPLEVFGTSGLQTVGFTPGPADVAVAMAIDEARRRLAIAGSSGMRDAGDALLRDFAVAVLEGPPGAAVFADGFEAQGK